jgi:hypothetical protein
MPTKRARYHHASDGELVRVTKGGFKEQCCSCGHTHRTEFRIVDGKLEFRAVTDNRATAAARRKFKFSKDED